MADTSMSRSPGTQGGADDELSSDELLKRIGWHPSEWAQIEVYARMSPARKVSQMLKLRHEQVLLLKERLRREHPECTTLELAHILQEHLELLNENTIEEG